jgi:predicted kinase
VPTFAILAGLPGSGKSTLAQNQLRAQGYFVVSTDLIRFAVNSGRYPRGADYKLLDPLVFALAEQAIRWLLERGHNAAIDATNLDRADRARWREFARRAVPGVRVEIHWCTGKWDSPQRWLEERDTPLDEYEEIRARLEKKAEEPAADEADALFIHGTAT